MYRAPKNLWRTYGARERTCYADPALTRWANLVPRLRRWFFSCGYASVLRLSFGGGGAVDFVGAVVGDEALHGAAYGLGFFFHFYVLRFVGGDDLVRQFAGHVVVVRELHGIAGAALGHRC